MLVLGVALLPTFALAYMFTMPAEDSVILYEYSKTLASRGIITYGNATAPIEGATDFLWMVVIAFLKTAGLPEFSSALLINFAGAIALIAMIKPVNKRLIVALGLLCTPYLYSSLSGFSAISISAIYCFCIFCLFSNTPTIYYVLLALCLTRPDGVLWGSGLVLLRLFDAKHKAIKTELIWLIVYLVIPGVIYYLWRLWYFSEWLPLPFYVKAFGEKDIHASLGYIRRAVVPALIATIVVEAPTVYLRRLFFFFILPCLFYAQMRLEQNIGNRFLAPLFFGVMLLLSYERRLLPLIVFVVASCWWSHKLTVETIRTLYHSREDNYSYIARDLGSLSGKMLVTEAGYLAYYSDWVVDDSWGLNTPKYAHNVIKSEDLRNNKYDLIAASCPIALLESTIPERNHDKRSWTNQCEVLVSYIQAAQYTVYLVPFVEPVKGVVYSSFINVIPEVKNKYVDCSRYHIFAVSPTYNMATELLDVLERHGGIKYPIHGLRHVGYTPSFEGCFVPSYDWYRK